MDLILSEVGNSADDTRGGAPKTSREDVINGFRQLAKDLEVRQGPVMNAYGQAWAGMTNSSDGWGERLVFGGLALLAAPAAGMEEIGRGILNIPSAMSNAIPLADQAGTELASNRPANPVWRA